MTETNQIRIIAAILVCSMVIMAGCSDEADDVYRPTQDPLRGLWSETYDYPLYNTATEQRVDTILTTKLHFLADSFDLKTYDESNNIVYYNHGSYSRIQDTLVFDLNIPSNSQTQKKMHYDLMSSSQLFLSTSETSGFIWGGNFGSDFYAILPKNNGLFAK